MLSMLYVGLIYKNNFADIYNLLSVTMNAVCGSVPVSGRLLVQAPRHHVHGPLNWVLIPELRAILYCCCAYCDLHVCHGEGN